MPRRTIRTTNRKRPNNNWAALTGTDYTVIPAASKVLLATFALGNPGIDETMLRVIGMFSIASDQNAAIEDQIGAVGLIQVTDQAIATGVAAIPGPGTDADSDGWFAHRFFAQQSVLVTTLDNSKQYDFESKGRRVVHDGYSVAVVVENVHATFGLGICLSFRALSRITGT